ncbi:MAG: hypothetical protein P8I90_02640 [Glaciecola sp.]|nr:hypothetical protein [Glaciecola sp.]
MAVILSSSAFRFGTNECHASQDDSNQIEDSDPQINVLATPPPQPLAASNDRVQAITHTATALANGDIATMHLLQIMHPHPLSLRNNPDYIDDDIMNNGVFLHEQVTLNQQALHPELLYDLYAKNLAEPIKP